MSVQPTVQNDQGVMLTIGFSCSGDRAAIVLPVGISTTTIDPATICYDAVTSFETTVLPTLLACLSANCNVTHIQGESMIDGVVPFRKDYGPTAQVGTGSTALFPSNVTGLMVFYEDPVDSPAGARMRVGKNFIPGIDAAGAVGDILSSAIVSLIQNLADRLLQGWVSTLAPTALWYRFLSAPATRVAGQQIRRVIIDYARNYVATQRRRLIPRG